MYEELNFDAKSYFLLELETEFYKKFNDKKLLERCYKEINILYDKNLLFIIEYLYKYKKENKNVSYYFRGKINNLLILYVLDLNIVNPVKYNLPYELFDDKYIKVDLINDLAINLLCYLDKQSDFKIVEGSHSKESVYEINKLADNHYLILPICNLKEDMLLKFNNEGILKTVDDYYNYTSEYIPIRIDEKSLIFDYEDIGIENVLENDFERNISKILMPKTFDDYVKIKSIAHSTQCYKNNQDKLIDKGLVDINNLIANKECIKNGLGIIAVPVEKIGEYFTYLIKYYETNDIKDIKKWIYDNCLDGIN